MSKYRFSILPSHLARYQQLLFTALACVSVWCWQPYIVDYQAGLQLLLCLLIVGAALFQFFATSPQNMPIYIVTLDETGRWIRHDSADQRTLQITPASRYNRWFAWVQLRNVNSRPDYHWVGVYCDQLRFEDFRRLCRVIRRQQYQGTNK